MRILLIHQYFLEKDDGGGSRWNEMTKMWANQGHEITVLAGMVHYATGKKNDKYRGKLFYRDQYAEGVEVIRCHVSELYNVNFLGRLWGYFSFVFSSAWAGLTKVRGSYDVVLVTSPPLFVGISGLFLKFLKKCPLVFEVRDLWPESAIDTGVLRNRFIIRLAYWFERRVYKSSKLVNTLTPAFQSILVEKKGVDKDKVIMIPNAADFSILNSLGDFDHTSLRHSMGWEDKFVLIYVGAHGVANDLIQLIDAAEMLKDTVAHFVLVGDGMQKEMLKEQVKNRALSNVQFLDSMPKKEIFKFIMASDVGVSILKKVDTFKTIYSNKTFDYLACKRPVLMCIDGVSRELIEVSNGGVYAEPEDVNDIVTKIQAYIQKPEICLEHGKTGYTYVKECFNRNKLANSYLFKIRILQKSTHDNSTCDVC